MANEPPRFSMAAFCFTCNASPLFEIARVLNVVGALEPGEVEEFEREREKFGKKAEDLVTQCYALHEAFALSLRSLT
jgi:hypothetical protein